MTLDDELLTVVEAARADLDALEDRAFAARARFHDEVRRLHRAGGSLREIAGALGMSHQRVHQIIGEESVVEVEAAASEVVALRAAEAPPPRPAGGPAPAAPVMVRRSTRLRCAFCNAGPGDTARLIAGPGVHVCQRCVGVAAEVVATRGPVRGPRQVTLRDASAERHPCRFCGRSPLQVAAMVAGGRGRICDACVGLAQEVLAG